MNKSLLQVALLMLIAFALGISKTSAQATAAASASANIVTPITISKTVDLDFGNVAVQATAGGTVELDTAGNRIPTAGVTLPAVHGTVSAAEFTVTGQGTYTYAITLPAFVNISDITNSHSMTVNAFTSNPSGIGTLSAIGSQKLRVGATLNVIAGQAAGLYTSGSPFTVTVNYN